MSRLFPFSHMITEPFFILTFHISYQLYHKSKYATAPMGLILVIYMLSCFLPSDCESRMSLWIHPSTVFIDSKTLLSTVCLLAAVRCTA
jgi:hypothetical protein